MKRAVGTGLGLGTLSALLHYCLTYVYLTADSSLALNPVIAVAFGRPDGPVLHPRRKETPLRRIPGLDPVHALLFTASPHAGFHVPRYLPDRRISGQRGGFALMIEDMHFLSLCLAFSAQFFTPLKQLLRKKEK